MLPPEPEYSPLSQTLRWAFRPLPFLNECRERHGDAFSVKFIGFKHPMVMLSNPAVLKALYTEPAHGLLPGREIALAPVVGPHSVLITEGPDHLAHRKLMLPAFHGERMRSHASLIEKIIADEIDSWPLGEPFTIQARMQAVTLEVILRVIFGVAEGPRLERLKVVLTEALEEVTSPSTQLIRFAARRFGNGRGPWARFEGKLREVDELLYAEIAEHRKRDDLEERDDILSALMLARFEDGEPMSDEDLRDQLMTLLVAGHETTTTSLAWTFDLLLRHPRELARLREAIEAGEEDFLRATVQEALRLRPVVPLAGRRLEADLEAEGLSLPAGTYVNPAIWLVHTRADVYPEPFVFRPERFLDEPPETYTWIPFGGGVRRCPGGAFAEFEMRIVLREVFGRCELRKADPRPERISRRGIIHAPKSGTPVIVTDRHPARELATA